MDKNKLFFITVGIVVLFNLMFFPYIREREVRVDPDCVNTEDRYSYPERTTPLYYIGEKPYYGLDYTKPTTIPGIECREKMVEEIETFPAWASMKTMGFSGGRKHWVGFVVNVGVSSTIGFVAYMVLKESFFKK